MPFSTHALVKIVQASLTPAQTALSTSAEQTFNPAGYADLEVGDVVTVSPPSITAGLVIGGCRVSAAGTLAITFGNCTAGNLTAPAGVYKVMAVKCLL